MNIIERVAQALCEARGFGFYTDPMEGGQDAYDISLQAMSEARAVIATIREPIDGVIEQCAQVAEAELSEDVGREVATAIRALKDKP